MNLVPQATLTPINNHNNTTNFGQDRYTTVNADHQTRFFTFDALGRQTQAQNQENGITNYLRFNALGQILETEDENGRANNYHLLHQYDARGREIAVAKKRAVSIAGGARILRRFDYESKKPNINCAAVRTCGKLVQTTAKNSGGVIRQRFTFRVRDGRLISQRQDAPVVNRPVNDLAFDYDSFGRQNLATYPDGRKIQLNFQFGGVKSVNSLVGTTLIPYANLALPGDYFADGDMAHFKQGNGVDYSREEDEAERRVKALTSTKPPCPPAAASAVAPPPCTAPTLVIWESGLYQYAGRGSERNQNREAHGHKTGNIIAIGNDQFTYDRLSRLKTATINRHPHSVNPLDTQPAGFVSLNYAYDIYGNITGL